MASVAYLSRPRCWDSPFDPEMQDKAVQSLLNRPETAEIDVSSFQENLPHEGKLNNDARLVRFNPDGPTCVRARHYNAFSLADFDLGAFAWRDI